MITHTSTFWDCPDLRLLLIGVILEDGAVERTGLSAFSVCFAGAALVAAAAFTGLLAGHFMVTLPYVIRVVGSSMEQFDFSIEEAAWSLGCPKTAAFFKVVLPNVTSGISSAFMLAFINSFNNIPVSMFLSGPGVSTFPSTLMNYIEYNYDPTVSAVSVLLMAATVIIMVVVDRTLGIAALAK